MIVDAINHERVAPLLEWAPLVLVHERSLEEVLSWGIKIDGVISKPSSVKNVTDFLADQMPLTIIELDTDRDGIDSLIEFLVNESQEAVCIVVRDVKKIMAMPLPLLAKLNVTLLAPDLRWSLIRNGIFEKWMSKDQKLSVAQNAPFHEKIGVVEQGNQLVTRQDGLIKLVNGQPFWLGEEY